MSKMRNEISSWARRQPPPPRRCSDSDMLSKEDGYRSKKKMIVVGGLKCRSRPYYFRRCKKERPTTTTIDSLPDELLHLILIRLSADYLYNRARLVCLRWNRIIHSHYFINAHLQHSTYGLVFPSCEPGGHPILMTAAQAGHELSYRLRSSSNIMFLGGCNGLVVEFTRVYPSKLYFIHILNPATKQAFRLPLNSADSLFLTGCGIAYAAASMEYKVTRSHVSPLPLAATCLSIVTAGVDKSWRQVGVDHLPKDISRLLFQTPLITEGFMHWTEQDRGTVLTLDVETEIFTVSEVPRPLLQDHDHYIGEQEHPSYYYLSTGRSLSVLIEIDCENYLWKLWEMNPETKEWMMLVDDIMLGAQKEKLQQFAMSPDAHLLPLGWVKYPEVLAIYSGITCKNRALVFYNLDTHEINSTELLCNESHSFFLQDCTRFSGTVYKSSLTWLT